MRGRPTKPDALVMKKITDVLRKNEPNEVWAMLISRESQVPKSTVDRYLKTYLAEKVTVVRQLGNMKMYRLK